MTGGGMLSNFFENKIVRITFYTICASVASEILYKYFQTWKRRVLKTNQDINEVLWTNDLTQLCKESHSKKRSPCKNKYCYRRNIKRLNAIIDNTKYTIDLCMYIFTSIELADALLRALKRGVKIRIICDETMVYSSGSQVIDLNKADIPVRYQTASGMLMHHKFCVFDGPQSMEKQGIKRNRGEETVAILLTGSTNWTFQGLAGNWDNIIVTSNESLIPYFEEEFHRMWEDFNSNSAFFDASR